MKNVIKVKESFKESLNKYSQPVHTYQKFTEGVGAGYDFTLFGLKLQNIKVSDVEDKSSEDWGPWKVGKFEAEIVPGAYDWEADHPYWYLSSKDTAYSYTIVDKVDVKGGKVSGDFETSAENIEDRLAAEKHDLRDMIGGGWSHTNLPDTLEMGKEDSGDRYKVIDMSEDDNDCFIEKATIELDSFYVNNRIEYAIYGGADDDESSYEADEEDWEEDEEEDLEESRRHPDPGKWKKGDRVIYKGKRYVTSLFMGGDMVKLESPDESIVVPQSEVYKATRKDIYNESKMRESKDESEEDISYLKYLLRKEEVTGLDKEERWELQDLISKYGYPEEYDESKIRESEGDITWYVDYIVGNTHKTKKVRAKTAKEAIKRARVKDIEDLRTEDEVLKAESEAEANRKANEEADKKAFLRQMGIIESKNSNKSKLNESEDDDFSNVLEFVDTYCAEYGHDFSEASKRNLAEKVLDYMYDHDFDINDGDYLDMVIRKYLENPEDFKESRRHPDPDKWKKGDCVIYKGKRYATSMFLGGNMVKLENHEGSIVVPQSEVYKATRKDIYNESKKHKRIMKESRAQDIKYLKYLLRKEEVTALDDEERWELQDMISKYGYPEEYDESRIKEDAYTSKVRQDVLAINAAKKQINDAVDSLDRKVAEVTNDIVQSANRKPVKPEVLTESERYSHKLVLKSDDGNGTFRIRNEKNYRYKSEEEAQEALDRLNKKFSSMLAGKKVHLEIEEIPKKPRKKANADEIFENPFKEGDILVGDIGYNCELPVFYKVTKVTPKCVYARRLATKFKDTDGYGQVGYLTPNVDDMRGEAIRMMVKKANHYEWEKKGTPDRYYVVLPDYSRNILNLWDGQPAYYNSMD